MTQDTELRELRDTLAITITQEMLRGWHQSHLTLGEMQELALTKVYGLADAVLSGRDRRAWITANEARKREGLPPRQMAEYVMPLPHADGGALFDAAVDRVIAHVDSRIGAVASGQAALDEAFVRANYPGKHSLLTYSRMPGSSMIGLNEREVGPNDEYSFEIATDPRLSPSEAWADARIVVERWLESGGKRPSIQDAEAAK